MATQERTLENQVIALAAVAQAATLIDKLARTGQLHNDDLKTLVYGLLQTNPATTESTYLSRNNLRCGLESLNYLLEQTSKPPASDSNYSEVMRLCLSMLHLQRKLSANQNMMAKVSEGIDQIKRKLEHFSQSSNTSYDDTASGNNPLSGASSPLEPALIHENILSAIASLYLETLSTFRFRIQVNGNPSYLQQESVINKIRTLLLCGIRAAVLWQQVGGTRFSILLKRKRYTAITTEMLRLH